MTLSGKRKALAVIAFLLILLLAVLAAHTFDLILPMVFIQVNDELLERADQPSGNHVLRAIYRDATLAESLAVYMGNEKNKGEPLFLLKRPVAIHISWENDDTVLIAYEDRLTDRDIITKVCVWNGIEIKYQATRETEKEAMSP
jgi:hypothetical protein